MGRTNVGVGVPQLYYPLPPGSIRLLRLNAQAPSTEAGALQVVQLGQTPPYYSLSHCWGTKPRTAQIQVDGHTLSISPDLAACIWRLRELAVEGSELGAPVNYIWIDNICINQDDIPERSSQVVLMGEIYSNSIKTLIWLGPHSNAASSAWGLIDKVYNAFRSQYPEAAALADIPVKAYSDFWHSRSELPDLDDESWIHLSEVLELTWFSRIWVVQEVVLSSEDPTIVHGDHCYPWHRLAWAATWLRQNGYARLSQIPAMVLNVDTMANLRRSRSRWPLDALMSITQTKFQATDQRDKVFALLGIAAESQDLSKLPDQLRPDYSVDVTEIYYKVAQFLLAQTQSLAMLTRARGTNFGLEGRFKRYDLDLPSWTPDWSDIDGFTRGIRTSFSCIHYLDTSKPVRLGFPEGYNASSGLALKLLSGPNEPVLRVKGMKLDQVTRVVPFNDRNFSKQEFVGIFRSKMPVVLKETMPLLVGRDVLAWATDLIKTTSAGQYYLSGRFWEQVMSDGLAYLYEILSQDQGLASLFLFQAGDDNAFAQLRSFSESGVSEEYAVLVRNFCFHRSFYVTSTGRMGLGPSDTRVGDIVCVIPGGDVPYVIRQNGSQWCLVGESYVQGLMDGEVARGHANEEEMLEFR
ncbi:hypothetical protein JX266_006985 [Neoarthrinium moseri]|nr:hypothetical protein JX266_006985 [Neoarthrinium moseri]